MIKHIPQEILDSIRERCDIVDVASQYVSLRRSGENFKGICPFHSERTPSFFVSPQKQIFHCFGCGVGGNVFTLVMKLEGLNFVEAVKFLANRFSLALNFPSEWEMSGGRDELLSINEEAASFFQKNLESRKGRVALKYLMARGLSASTITNFRIGYAPCGWSSIRDELVRVRGFQPEKVEEAGLILKGERGSYYDRFRDRIIFPIFDLNNRVVGFGGRVLGDGEPKYINTPETPVYSKGKILYGLNFAKQAIQKLEETIIVEGYTDVILAHQAGLKNVVATSGTSMTKEHATLLRRFGKKCTIVYDSDEAGAAATLRSLNLLIEKGLRVKVALLPLDSDPADLLKERGVNGFKEVLAEAQDLFEYRLNKALCSKDISSLEGKADVVNELKPLILLISNPIEQYELIRRIADKLKIDEKIVLEEMKRGGKSPLSIRSMVDFQKRTLNIEWELISLILSDKEILNRALIELEPHDFEEDRCREIFNSIREWKGDVEPCKIIDFLGEDACKVVSWAALREVKIYDKMKLADDYIKRIKRGRVNQKLESLRKEISEAESSGKTDSLRDLLHQYQNLIAQAKSYS